MEQFTCLKCGTRGSFDPRSGPAVCPQCGYTPPMDRRVSMMDFDELRLAKEKAHLPARPSETQAETRLSLLDELISHWEGMHTPDPSVELGTKGEARAAFRAYQRALGEDLKRLPGIGTRYVRSHQPEKKAILWFVAAYLIALIFNVAFAGIQDGTLKLAAILAPSTIAGIFAGQYVSDKVSESTFRYLLMIILVLTAASLLVTAV